MGRRILSGLFVLVLLAPVFGGDVIHLKDGSAVEVRILSRDRDRLVVRIEGGPRIEIPHRYIERIEKERHRGAFPKRHTATCPAACPRCDRLFSGVVSRFCRLIAGRPESRPIPYSKNEQQGLDYQVPTAALFGLVLLGEGNTLETGEHAANLRRISRFVRTADMSPEKRPHLTWSLAFSTLFLAELHGVSPSHRL